LQQASELFARLHPADVDHLSNAVAEAVRTSGAFDVIVRIRRRRPGDGADEFVSRRLQGHAVGRRLATHLAGVISVPLAGLKVEARYGSRAIDTLAVGLAHEFNNVLQIVKGYVEFARQSLPYDSESLQDLDHALAAADRATQLTRRLGEFASASDSSCEHTDLADVVSEFDILLRPILGDAVRYRCATASERMFTLAADASVRQAILNLCMNARDAMPRGGELLLRSEGVIAPAGGLQLAGGQTLPPGRYARVWVTDSGEGIPPERLLRIWDLFYTTKPGSQGSGLGLPTVRATANRLGGAATVHSVEGVGTSFAIYVPVSGGPRPPAQCVDASGRSVLVVGSKLLAAARSLSEQGWRVRECRDLGAALAVAAEPDYGGTAVLVEAETLRGVCLDELGEGRSAAKRPLIVAVTEFDPESNPALRVSRGASAIVSYPLVPSQLAAIAARPIGRSAAAKPPDAAEVIATSDGSIEQALIDAGLVLGSSRGAGSAT
jgi:signal transduction histidine kinase